MLKEKIKYTTFDGVECEETFYFNISRGELSDLQFSTKGSLSNHINTISETQDVQEGYRLFKEVLLMSYGVKSADGKMFIKKDADGNYLGEAFQYHAAYDELYKKITDSEESIAAFFNAVVPTLTPEEQAKAAELQNNRQGFQTM